MTFRPFSCMVRVARRKEGKNVNITYNIPRLQQIVDDLCTLCGVAMAVADTNLTFLYANLAMSHEFCSTVQKSPQCLARCRRCDRTMLSRAEELRRPFSHICHAGLWDSGMPIIKEDITVGYIIFGRVRDRALLDGTTLEDLAGYGLDREVLLETYEKTPLLSEEKRQSLLRLLSHIFFEGAIEIDHEGFIHRATEYIERHLGERLSIETLCAKLFVSKNYLYKSFHSFFGKTVGEYITDKRIERAKTLLTTTERRAAEIADEVGIDNHTYFARLFKKKTGLSPIGYRKQFS